VIRRAGFTERTKTGINKLHIHSTRKFFRTQFGQAAGPDAAETLMGHSPGLTSNYRLLEEAQLAQIFKKHERALFINRDKEAELVKERVEKQSDRIAAQDRIIEKMQRELDILVHAAEIAEKMKV